MHDAFGGLVERDQHGVLAEQFTERGFALGERGFQERVAVGGQNNFTGLGYIDNLDAIHVDGGAVDDGVGLVLALHRTDDVAYDEIPSAVVFHNLFCREMTAQDIFASFLRIGGFLRLVVLKQHAINEALAVANEPYLTMMVGIDGGAACEPSFGMLPDNVGFDVETIVNTGNGLGGNGAKFRAAGFRR